MVKADLKRLGLEFRSRADYDAFLQLYMLRLKHPELRVPFALDRHFLLSKDPEEQKLAPLVRQIHDADKQRLHAEIRGAEDEIGALSQGKPTAANRKKIEARERKLDRLKKKLEHSLDHISPLDERIFPGYFAPVILASGTERLLVPMRYRVRRPDGGEVPPQYNVFNARRDSLTSAATWKPLFAKRHALFPFTKFFEWVERDGKKQEIAFSPENRSIMWAASLYSNVKPSHPLPFRSFAMVTDEPPPEVAAAGHDRCPVFLESNRVDAWLQPSEHAPEELLALLDHKEKTFYLHSLVA